MSIVPAPNGSVADVNDGDRVENGSLLCAECGKATQVIDRVWHAMGEHTWHKTLAQFSNIVPPTPQLYERLWRVRSLSLLSGRSFPIREELDELISAMLPQGDSVFVDVACSEGLYARALADRGATVIAIDHSRPFLRRVVKRSGNRRIVAVRAMAQHLPILSGAVEGAVLGGSLNEIGDQQTCVSEMARVLKSGGRTFSMSLTTATTRPGRILQRVLSPSGITTPSLEATTSLFRDAGLSVLDSRLDRVVARITAERGADSPTG